MDDPTPTSPAWFSRVGRPFADAEHVAIEAMIRSHPELAEGQLGGIGRWHEAGELLRAAERDDAWWEHEEDERARLWERAADRHVEDELLARLTAVTQILTDAVHGAAAAAAARAGVADPALVRAAAGAALLAAHQRALAALAGEGPAHFFARKYALFAGGRWPLGCHRGRYVVF
jgi:hypothetical protein